MSETTSSTKNLLQFTVKLTLDQLEYLDDLADVLRLSTQRSALREVLEQFESWFRLPVSMRERLKKDVAERKVSILRYLQELMARHSEELAKESTATKRAPLSKGRPGPAAAEPMEQLGIRLSPSVLAYCDELKPQLGVGSTADVMREIISQLQGWFDLPGYMAERLQREMTARRLNIIEYVQEVLAQRYEALREEARAAAPVGRQQMEPVGHGTCGSLPSRPPAPLWRRSSLAPITRWMLDEFERSKVSYSPRVLRHRLPELIERGPPPEPLDV